MDTIPLFQVNNNTTVALSTDLGIGPADIPFEAIAFIAVLLIAAIVLLTLFRWRRLRIMPGKASVPGDGKTALPIRVMLVNGFGMRRRPSTNMEVELEATAGTIRNVVLPISQNIAEAMLVPSREFGPVTVTAKAGRKRAKAGVTFACDGGSIDVSVSPGSIQVGAGSSASVRVRIVDKEGAGVAPLRDMDIVLTSSLGRIAGGVRIPARTPEAVTPIAAGDTPGTAVISASSDGFRGHGEVIFQTTDRQFCMYDRAAMASDAKKCPKCGRERPTDLYTRACVRCGTILPAPAAKFCYSCGEPQPEWHT